MNTEYVKNADPLQSEACRTTEYPPGPSALGNRDMENWMLT